MDLPEGANYSEYRDLADEQSGVSSATVFPCLTKELKCEKLQMGYCELEGHSTYLTNSGCIAARCGSSHGGCSDEKTNDDTYTSCNVKGKTYQSDDSSSAYKKCTLDTNAAIA